MRQRGRIVRRITRLVDGLIYREIDIHVAEAEPLTGPVIAVSNHFGGLADGVLLVDSLPRMPRIVARDVIWKVPIAGQIMAGIGGIPVHQRADGGKTSNDEMFGSCYEALADGDLILIFPEGVTQDDPHIAPVKTGAARIALGARAVGVDDIKILPVGIHYEDKAGFRSRVLVNAGAPLSVDEWVAAHGGALGADDHPAVKELTAEIEERLRRAAPDFPDWPTAHAYETAATVPLHDVDSSLLPIRYGDSSLLADQLKEDGPDPLREAASDYRAALANARTTDLSVARAGKPSRSPSQSWLRDLIVTLLLLPYGIVGALTGLIPWLLVKSTRFVPASPAVRATLIPGLAIVAYGAAWFWFTYVGFRDAGPTGAAVAFLLIPLFWAATVFVSERAKLLWWQWRSTRPPPKGALGDLQARRADLSARVWGRL